MPRVQTRDLVVCYIGDASLWGAMTMEEWRDGMDFPLEARDDDDYETAILRDVPNELAQMLLEQGTSAQWFSDGYDAANAAAPYLDRPDDDDES